MKLRTSITQAHDIPDEQTERQDLQCQISTHIGSQTRTDFETYTVTNRHKYLETLLHLNSFFMQANHCTFLFVFTLFKQHIYLPTRFATILCGDTFVQYPLPEFKLRNSCSLSTKPFSRIFCKWKTEKLFAQSCKSLSSNSQHDFRKSIVIKI